MDFCIASQRNVLRWSSSSILLVNDQFKVWEILFHLIGGQKTSSPCTDMDNSNCPPLGVVLILYMICLACLLYVRHLDLLCYEVVKQLKPRKSESTKSINSWGHRKASWNQEWLWIAMANQRYTECSIKRERINTSRALLLVQNPPVLLFNWLTHRRYSNCECVFASQNERMWPTSDICSDVNVGSGEANAMMCLAPESGECYWA